VKTSKPVDPLSSLALEWTPIQLANNGKVIVDVFKCSLSAMDGLPPYAQARIIDLIATRLIKARPRACLWVSVDAPGRWYLHEMVRLVKRKMPILILPAGQTPKDHWDFTPHGYPSLAENTPAPQIQPPFDPADFGYKPNAIRVLRILARLGTAHKPEITSLAGLSETYIRALLKKLQAANLIERKRIGKYEGWAIRSSGLKLAHRSWNIPKAVHFKKHRGEFRYAADVAGVVGKSIPDHRDLGLLDRGAGQIWHSGCPGLGDALWQGNLVLAGSGYWTQLDQDH